MTKKEKGVIDSIFDVADEVMDKVEDVLKEKEPDEEDEEDVEDAEFEDVPKATKAIPERIPGVHSAPTAPSADVTLGCVMPERHWHIFEGLSNVSFCGDMFEPQDIVSRRAMDIESHTKFVVCIGCIARAIKREKKEV